MSTDTRYAAPALADSSGRVWFSLTLAASLLWRGQPLVLKALPRVLAASLIIYSPLTRELF